MEGYCIHIFCSRGVQAIEHFSVCPQTRTDSCYCSLTHKRLGTQQNLLFFLSCVSIHSVYIQNTLFVSYPGPAYLLCAWIFMLYIQKQLHSIQLFPPCFGSYPHFYHMLLFPGLTDAVYVIGHPSVSFPCPLLVTHM